MSIVMLILCMTVPSIALMGLAGRVVDGSDSRKILVAASLTQATAGAALALYPVPGVIFPAIAIISAAQCFAQPTWQALIPEIVGTDLIGKAVAWQQSLNALAGPAGAGLGGVLYGVGLHRWGFGIDAGSYLLLCAAAVAIRHRRIRSGKLRRSMWRIQFRDLDIHAMVWPLLVAMAFFALVMESISPAEVFLVRDALGATPAQYGLAEICAAAGGVAGAYIAGNFSGNRQRASIAFGGFFLTALALGAAGAAPEFWLYVILALSVSLFFATANGAFTALLTTTTNPSERGRVFASLGGLIRAAGLIGLGVGGLVTTVAGPRELYVGTGLLGCAFMGACWLLSSRHRA